MDFFRALAFAEVWVWTWTGIIAITSRKECIGCVMFGKGNLEGLLALTKGEGVAISVIFLALYIDFNYAKSLDKLNENYNKIKIFLIYGSFSSIGLISGGILGSWLKVADILKLP